MLSATKRQAQARRIQRVRSKIQGTKERPRLSLSFSNSLVRAQLVDDTTGKTLAYCTSKAVKQSLSQQAESLAKELAQQAKAAKVTTVVFDRRHKPYHGRVKIFAEALRQEGVNL